MSGADACRRKERHSLPTKCKSPKGSSHVRWLCSAPLVSLRLLSGLAIAGRAGEQQTCEVSFAHASPGRRELTILRLLDRSMRHLMLPVDLGKLTA